MGDFHTAVALIVATDTEETAVRHMYEWTQRTVAEDGQPYYEACFSRGSEEHRVVMPGRTRWEWWPRRF